MTAIIIAILLFFAAFVVCFWVVYLLSQFFRLSAYTLTRWRFDLASFTSKSLIIGLTAFLYYGLFITFI